MFALIYDATVLQQTSCFLKVNCTEGKDVSVAPPGGKEADNDCDSGIFGESCSAGGLLGDKIKPVCANLLLIILNASWDS